MLYSQPIAHRFGFSLVNDIESNNWSHIEFAVAWVRHSGIQHLEPSLRGFLQNGGRAQITVGVDVENTSEDGLQDLLNLKSFGDIEIFVHHNESDSIFHPKLYLLRNTNNARLIVCSNNLTGAGLFINTEAGLQIDAPVNDPTIVEARTALAAWRDVSSGFAKVLDSILLKDLVSLGYVFSENVLSGRRKASSDASKGKRQPRQALFKFDRITMPHVKTSVSAAPANVAGTVLLMRVRRASANARRTQIQIPFRVVNTNFFSGINELVSAHDNRKHKLVYASARGSANTIKVEIPEIDTMGDPVLRLERTSSDIVYQAYDATSILGTPIHQALLHGFMMMPPQSTMSIKDQSKATWWRFV